MPFDSTTGKIFLCLLLGFIAVQVVFKFVWKLGRILLFLFGTMMACLHVRFLLLFVPLFAPGACSRARTLDPAIQEAQRPLLTQCCRHGCHGVLSGAVFPGPRIIWKQRIASPIPRSYKLVTSQIIQNRDDS